MRGKIKLLLNHKIFFLCSLLVMAVILITQSDRYFKWSNPPEAPLHNISSDGSGYYAYLPQIFIYGTKHFEFTESISNKYPGSKFYEGVTPAEGSGKSNKYFAGSAICIAPFFLTAHQITKITGGEADGYSANYEISVLLAAVAFWLLGILSLLALLTSYGISRFAILFGAVGLTFATNLNYYIVYDPSFSHVYTFGLVCFFLLQVKRFAVTAAAKHFWWICILLGLITIIRPTNLLVILLIPFFFEKFKSFWNALLNVIFKRKKVLFLGIVLFGLLIFIQFLNIHSQYGFWGFNAYSTEGFDYLLSPKFGEVLFGFRKGFFVYTPFLLLVIPGMYFLFRWNRYFFWGFSIFTILFTYIMASWWCWYYGGSLGMRPLVDIYGVLILPVVLLFERIHGLFKVVLIGFTALMIHYNLVLNYQLMHSILHYADMDKSKFKTIFLQKGKRFEWIFHMKQPRINLKNYKAEQKFYFDGNQWSESPAKAEITMASGTYLQSLNFEPDPALKDKNVAISLNYEMLIESDDNIPKALLYGYNHGEREHLNIHFVGEQIASLNKFYKIQAYLPADKLYQSFDSIAVVIENGTGEGKLKNIKAEILRRK